MAKGGDVHLSGQRAVLYSATITAAVSGSAPTTPQTVLSGMSYLVCEAIFTYGSGGTTAKAWVQTSLDGGVTWIDIMSFAFTTATASKVSAVVVSTALAAGITPGDAALADNTILSGLLGDRIRVKVTTTGTYGGNTTLVVHAIAKG